MKFGNGGILGDTWNVQTMRVLIQRSKNDLDLLF